MSLNRLFHKTIFAFLSSFQLKSTVGIQISLLLVMNRIEYTQFCNQICILNRTLSKFCFLLSPPDIYFISR